METGFEVENKSFFLNSVSLSPDGETYSLFKLLQLWENYKDKK